MENLYLTLKPSSFNALVPLFLRNLLYSSIVVIVLHFMMVLLQNLNIIHESINLFLIDIFILLFLVFIPLISKGTILFNTTYLFFKTHITKEFEFGIVKKHSVLYNQITNIELNISLWDRMCKSGDLTLKTADDSKKDLVLYFIKNPIEVEKKIYHIMHLNKNKS